MNRQAFEHLFFTALSRAVDVNEKFSKHSPSSFIVAFHGFGSVGERMGVSAVVDKLFVDESRFFRIVDVALINVEDSVAIAFVRVSGHQPASWAMTWDPQDLGPFKVLTSLHSAA